MKFDFFEFINSNQLLTNDFKKTNNNSFNFDSIKIDTYKINHEKDTLEKIFDI